MTPENEPFPWIDVSDAAVYELLRQAELQLGDLLTASIAADQRATTLASFFGAGAVGVSAVDATMRAAGHFNLSWTVSFAVLAIGLFIASLTCGFSGSPQMFFSRGYEPRRLIVSARDEVWMIRFAVEDAQVRIEHNREALKRTATLTHQGFQVAIGSILLSVVTFAVFLVSA